MNSASRSVIPGIGLLLASVVGPASAGMPAGLLEAVRGTRMQIDSVRSHSFVDLDGDGIKEILLEAEGTLTGPLPHGTVLVPDRLATPETGPSLVVPAVDRCRSVLAAFRFDRTSFRWAPSLVAAIDPDRTEVGFFGAVAFPGGILLRISLKEGSRIRDHLYRLRLEGGEEVFRFERGQSVGEGLWTRAGKLLAIRGLGHPFRPEASGPGFLVRTRYRWTGNRMEAEDWSVTPFGFRGDLGLPAIPVWSPEEVTRPELARRAWDLQRASDRGTGRFRTSLEELCRYRLGEEDWEIVHRQDGFAVVVEQAAGGLRTSYYLQPFLAARGEREAVWIALDELASP